MAEVLKIFQEGEDILASETNANNNYLLGKISDNASTLQNYVEGEITSIQSSLASAQATLQNSLNELTSKVNSGLADIHTKINPDFSKAFSIASGYKATQNGWVYIHVRGYSGGRYTIVINGKTLTNETSDGGLCSATGSFRVSKGDVVEFTGATGGGPWFIPEKA
jgi:hypothetical protein